MPYRLLAEEVLARWREGERRLETADAEERPVISAEIDQLRAEYAALVELARDAHLREPPPLPEET
jgi:hypothetical protein